MNETDPNGKPQHAPGAKLDAGKLRADLVLRGFARALTEVVKVGTYGAVKYTPNGWEQVPDGVERYADAKVRHQLAEWRGEANDAQSEILHAAHEAWNCLARLELLVCEIESAKRRLDTLFPVDQIKWAGDRASVTDPFGEFEMLKSEVEKAKERNTMKASEAASLAVASSAPENNAELRRYVNAKIKTAAQAGRRCAVDPWAGFNPRVPEETIGALRDALLKDGYRVIFIAAPQRTGEADYYEVRW